ncbi:MAG TPA: phage/plasmid replication protein, II/X family [Thermomicrobiales bacterium]|jgi:II/X family phage/plasmid replication protein
MIDWVSCVIPCRLDTPISDGTTVTLDRDGNTVRVTDHRATLRGSYDTAATVRSRGNSLLVSVNPAKWNAGHNAFGTNNLQHAIMPVFFDLADKLGLMPRHADIDAWLAGDYHLTRLDLARTYHVGTPADVAHILAACATVTRIPRQEKVITGATVRLGRRGSRWSLSLYDKLTEMGKHPPSPLLPADDQERLAAWATGKIRFDLSIGPKTLSERGLQRGSAWTPEVAEAIMSERIQRVQFSDTIRLADDVIDTLPGTLVGVYEAWRSGRDVRRLFAPATFYRHRKALIAHGIDIARPRPRVVTAANDYAGGVPLAALFSGPGVPVPDWSHPSATAA